MLALCKILSFGHRWNGCKCSACGKTRDQAHDWQGPGQCICANCGKTDHRWHNCKCFNCNAIRDKNHDWQGCKCFKCGKTRDQEHDFPRTQEYAREGGLCKCMSCGKTWAHDW